MRWVGVYGIQGVGGVVMRVVGVGVGDMSVEGVGGVGVEGVGVQGVDVQGVGVEGVGVEGRGGEKQREENETLDVHSESKRKCFIWILDMTPATCSKLNLFAGKVVESGNRNKHFRIQSTFS